MQSKERANLLKVFFTTSAEFLSAFSAFASKKLPTCVESVILILACENFIGGRRWSRASWQHKNRSSHLCTSCWCTMKFLKHPADAMWWSAANSSQNNASGLHGVFVRKGCGAELDTQLHSELICPARGAACWMYIISVHRRRTTLPSEWRYWVSRIHTGHETQKCVCPTDVSPPPREAFN